MKKLILTVAVVLGGLVAMNAQEAIELKPQISKDQKKAEILEKKGVVQNQKSLRATTTDTESKKAAKRDFQSVDNNQVPNVVQEQVKLNYNDATISKASLNSKGIYRLEILDANNSKKVVYMDKDGQLINQSLRGQK